VRQNRKHYCMSVTNSMDRSFLRSRQQRTPHPFWKSKVHYRVHISSPPDLILSWLKQIDAFMFLSFVINLILSSHLPLDLYNCRYPSYMSAQILYALLSSLCVIDYIFLSPMSYYPITQSGTENRIPFLWIQWTGSKEKSPIMTVNQTNVTNIYSHNMYQTCLYKSLSRFGTKPDVLIEIFRGFTHFLLKTNE
jgi:hypothetical protein